MRGVRFISSALGFGFVARAFLFCRRAAGMPVARPMPYVYSHIYIYILYVCMQDAAKNISANVSAG
jgi:hypothetical protein